MKNQKLYKKLISSFFLIISFVSCNSNDIYVDIKEQCVVRKNGYLTDLIIYNRDYTSHFSIDGKYKCRSDRFYLTNMKVKNPDYNINSIENSILPNTEYEVLSRSNGDAGACYLHFKTDSLGRICWTDKNKNSKSGGLPWD